MNSYIENDVDAFDREMSFLYWAFGENIPVDKAGKMEAWNALHGNKLQLKPTDKIAESLVRMFKIYLSETRQDGY